MTEEKIKIYGTETCPFTQQARAAYGEKAIFISVDGNTEKLDEMLAYSGGNRFIPIIVDGEKVTIGFSQEGHPGGG